MWGIKISNWNKPSIQWLNNLCYAYYAVLTAIVGGEIGGLLPVDYIEKPLLMKMVLGGYLAKFIIKLTQQSDSKNDPSSGL